MGDDKAGPPLQQTTQGLLDQQLGTGIHATRRFVQDQQAGIGQDGPGDGYKLPLALAKVPPLFR